ncbi:MAG: hypothetical protein Q4A48_07715, partial [Bacillota bacterium]|nr:hypothetical protein [Bacillota bacterium]
IVAVVACENYIIGLKKDGTLIATRQGNLSKLKDIVAISETNPSSDTIVCLKKDGTTAAIVCNLDGELEAEDLKGLDGIKVESE